MKIFTKCLVLFLVMAASAVGAEVNWPGWRGADGNGSATKGDYPVKWDVENVLWNIDIGGKGRSTPIVWNK